MKETSYLLKIEHPCQENWHEMRDVPVGRYCLHCQKQVYDFTEFTDKELLDILENFPEKICGRFRKEQINRVLKNTQTSHKSPRFSVVAASLLALSTTNVAVGNPMEIKTENQVEIAPTAASENRTQLVEEPCDTIKKRVIYGYLKDPKQEPLIGASVKIVDKNIGASTDIDGYYELALPDEDWTTKGFTLEYSSIGMKTAKRSIKNARYPLRKDIILKNEGILMGDVVIVKYHTPKKQIKIPKILRKK